MNKTLNDMPLRELINMSESPQTQGLNILETYKSSSLRPNTYINNQKKNNHVQLKELFNGMKSLNDIVHLQVKGRNQLDKEIHELSAPESTAYLLDSSAIQRNEMTQEIDQKNYESDESL